MSDKDEEVVSDLQASFGRMVSTFLTSIIYTIGRGYLLYLGWMWFIVPLDAPMISIFHAIGIAVALRIVCIPLPNMIDISEYVKKRKEMSNADVSRVHFLQFLSFIFSAVITLGIMYFTHRVM